MDKRDIFWQEKRLLEKSKKCLQETDGGDVSAAEYKELLTSYADVLKQLSQLTRFSDRNDKRMRILTDKLKRYVSPPLYKKITSGKETVEINKTKRVRLSIFFSDIVNFSWHSRDMEGEALSAFLNSYLEEMTIIANDYGGTLDKYIGDAIMVFFGDPVFISDQDHALRCVKMALAMRKRLRELQQHWFELGYANPLHIRMGISTGHVSVGNFGSSERLDYTIIGTPVNLAARLQGAAAEDQILISHSTWALVKDEIPCSEAILMLLKGFDAEQLAHEVLGQEDAPNSEPRIIENKELGYSLKWDENKISREDLIKLLRE
jgi:adenylate cyclase